jgi:hypothetical protein
VENPIVRRAVELCDQAGMKIIYHEDAVEVWFSPAKKRIYTTWSQFLADAENLFGPRLHDAPETPAPVRASFGNRRVSDPPPERAPERAPELAMAEAPAAASAHHAHINGHAGPAFGTAPSQAAEAPKPSGPRPDDATQAELTRLRTEIRVLERAIKVVGMQSEEWKRETEAARRELETTRAEMANMVDARMSLSGQPDRYKQVRQIIVKRLHPDIHGTDEEKAYREKMFKSIWQDIEALDRRSS